MSPKFKKYLSNVLKLAVFILVFWYVYRLLMRDTGLKDFKALLSSVGPSVMFITIGLVLVLMLLNWLIETLKWRFICEQFQPISFRKAFESVFSGLAWAIFTPNRIGEYGGRVLFLNPKKRVLGVVGMGVGAISQMVITNVVGVWAFFWFVNSYLDLSRIMFFGSFVLAIICSVFFLVLYFRINLIHHLLARIRFLRKYHRFLDLLLRYDHEKLRKIFFYSLLRYVVFTFQYCLLIQVLIPNLPVFEMVMMIFILFFVQSALPSLDLFDVGVRGLTASYFFGFLTEMNIAVMAIAAFIWFVNLIIPAVIGSFFTFKIRFFDANSN